jgi:hypothetical protein
MRICIQPEQNVRQKRSESGRLVAHTSERGIQRGRDRQEDDTMSTNCTQPSTGVDQQHVSRSALSKSIYAAFVVIVALATLAGTALVLWLLSLLANSSYGVYVGA